MKFFSGFCLNKEEELFEDFLQKNRFTVAGFSKGAIEALKYALKTSKRVDKLQLFSPAFFQNKNEKFKKTQTLFFRKDKKRYIENFLKNVSYPSKIDMRKYFKEDDEKTLSYLLNYQWSENDFKNLEKKGIFVEVYLGEKDKIIDSKEAFSFFKNYAQTYFIKNVGHILKGE